MKITSLQAVRKVREGRSGNGKVVGAFYGRSLISFIVERGPAFPCRINGIWVKAVTQSEARALDTEFREAGGKGGCAICDHPTESTEGREIVRLRQVIETIQATMVADRRKLEALQRRAPSTSSPIRSQVAALLRWLAERRHPIETHSEQRATWLQYADELDAQ